MTTRAAPALLDGNDVLNGAGGRYWQFHAGGPARVPLAPGAVYVETETLASVLPLLEDAARWFIADGVSRIESADAEALARGLRVAARMPDERRGRATWSALADWLDRQQDTSVWVQQQRFAPRGAGR